MILWDVRRVLVMCSIRYCVILNRIIDNRPVQLLLLNAVKIYSVEFEFERTIFSKNFEFEFEFLMGSDRIWDLSTIELLCILMITSDYNILA